MPSPGARSASSPAHPTSGAVSPRGVRTAQVSCRPSFGLHGVALPRDSAQQAEAGKPLDLAPDALASGDLLFFSDRPDRRITHVAISLGGPRFVHLALGRGGYKVEDLSDMDDPYVAALRARYLFARRLL